jgi:hypothetical protein
MNCALSAETNECESYTAVQTSTTGPCAAEDGGATQTACFPQTDNDITNMVTFMCGGLVAPPPDAGTDAGTPKDAGTDSGAPKDAGKDSSAVDAAGSDGGDTSFNQGGCHCDAAGVATTNTLVVMSLGVLAAAAAAVRRRKRR